MYSDSYRDIAKERHEHRLEQIRLKVESASSSLTGAGTDSSAASSGLTKASSKPRSLGAVAVFDGDYVATSVNNLLKLVCGRDDIRSDPELLVLPQDADPPCAHVKHEGWNYKEWARLEASTNMLTIRLVTDIPKEMPYTRSEEKAHGVGSCS